MNSRPLPSDAEQIAIMGDAEIAALNREVERLTRSERLTRGKLATMCEAVMVRVQELEATEEEAKMPALGVIAKKLRGAVLSATDFTSASTNHGS